MTPILQREAPVLHETAGEVPIDEITSLHIQAILAKMKVALDKEDDGAALAAPQIGLPLRIFVISERLFGDNEQSDYRSKDRHFVFINPELLKLSKKKVSMDEGCLSVRGLYGTVKRHNGAVVRAYDEYGKRFTRGASGLLAQVFQHETDHLNGTLFIDKADEVWTVDTKPKEA